MMVFRHVDASGPDEPRFPEPPAPDIPNDLPEPDLPVNLPHQPNLPDELPSEPAPVGPGQIPPDELQQMPVGQTGTGVA